MPRPTVPWVALCEGHKPACRGGTPVSVVGSQEGIHTVQQRRCRLYSRGSTLQCRASRERWQGLSSWQGHTERCEPVAGCNLPGMSGHLELLTMVYLCSPNSCSVKAQTLKKPGQPPPSDHKSWPAQAFLCMLPGESKAACPCSDGTRPPGRAGLGKALLHLTFPFSQAYTWQHIYCQKGDPPNLFPEENLLKNKRVSFFVDFKM